jgi:hypothetical protein
MTNTTSPSELAAQELTEDKVLRTYMKSLIHNFTMVDGKYQISKESFEGDFAAFMRNPDYREEDNTCYLAIIRMIVFHRRNYPDAIYNHGQIVDAIKGAIDFYNIRSKPVIQNPKEQILKALDDLGIKPDEA